MKLIAIISLLLMGCTTFTPTENRDVVTLKIIINNDLSWLGLDTPDRKILGYSKCIENNCVIWVPSVDKPYADCVWADELKHVKYGNHHQGKEYQC